MAGELILASVVDLKVVEKFFRKVEDASFQSAVSDAVMGIVAAEIKACEELLH